MVTEQELKRIFVALELSVRASFLFANVQPRVSEYVSESDAKTYADKLVENWYETNKEITDEIHKLLCEVMLEDAGTIFEQISKMSEGIDLMFSAIRHYMPERIPTDCTLDNYDKYIKKE